MPSSCMVPKVIHLVETAAAGQFAAYVVGQKNWIARRYPMTSGTPLPGGSLIG